ncbi:hypothetical protein WICMUC_000022 [Wickerhamomyces mucosus]|uniref:Arrestin C-terminal-like domain-containing protein n=1 Tax=Wickerhamomyces mucosus TaxID=1378264 RepID=A0A9P8PZ73_9ASCO|nr:hypothetical protein WICMUC_000022 [Wickerhamomyces mucosus]
MNWDNLFNNSNGFLQKFITKKFVNNNNNNQLNSNTLLLPGNYEIPFNCCIPGDIPESIEGILPSSIMYKFELIILEIQSSNLINLTKFFKHFRILRTLSNDSLILNEMISLEKILPNLLQFEISLPSKAIAIGDIIPLNILMIPLIKSIQLINIKFQLICKIHIKSLKTNKFYQDELILKNFEQSFKQFEINSKINFKFPIHTSNNLKKITPNCEFQLNSLIKISYFIKIFINFLNPITKIKNEIIFKIPIIFYINPILKILNRQIFLDSNGKFHFKKFQDLIFKRNNFNNYEIQLNHIELPNYENHIYDNIVLNTNNNEINNNQQLINNELKEEDEEERLNINEIPNYEDSLNDIFYLNTIEGFSPDYKE